MGAGERVAAEHADLGNVERLAGMVDQQIDDEFRSAVELRVERFRRRQVVGQAPLGVVVMTGSAAVLTSRRVIVRHR
jgi:hypothetical protein